MLILLITHWQGQEISCSEHPARNQRLFLQDEEKRKTNGGKLEASVIRITGPQVEIV